MQIFNNIAADPVFPCEISFFNMSTGTLAYSKLQASKEIDGSHVLFLACFIS
jgi:hypothetical protein